MAFDKRLTDENPFIEKPKADCKFCELAKPLVLVVLAGVVAYLVLSKV